MAEASLGEGAQVRLNLGSGVYTIDGWENLDAAGHPGTTLWRWEDGLPYEDATVEAITVAHSLMYVPDSLWPRVFFDMARVLRPGGVLRITEDSAEDPESERFGGHHDAVSMTSPGKVIDAMRAAGLRAQTVEPRETHFRDPAICQVLHGLPPKVFFVEGVKTPQEAVFEPVVTRPRISVLIPTTGRKGLVRAIQSAADADEVLVDYNQDGDKGYAARTRMMARASGTHLAFLDDDDVYAPGAVGAMRDAACDYPVIFRMRYHHGGSVLWGKPELGYGNVGSPMLLVPNVPEKLGRWRGWNGENEGGDATFIHECAERFGEVRFDERITAIIRPDGSV